MQFDLFNKTWGELWSDYYSKAKRYDDKSLFEIFGDNQPVDKDITSCVPIENNNHQRLLFGDFLRQQHHRMAYQIAKQGLPGFECYIDVFENSNINDVDREIVGLIAFNGIHIIRFLKPFESDQRYNNYWSINSQYGFSMHLPTISVKDKVNKYVKTDLARTNVTGFKLELSFVRNIYKYFIAQILKSKFEPGDKEYPWFHFYKGKMPLAISDKGFTVLAQSFILDTEKDVICFLGRFKNFEELDVNHSMLKSHFYNSCGYYGASDALYYRDFLYEDIYVNGERLVQFSKFLPCCVYAIIYDSSSYCRCNCTMSLADYLNNPDINKNYSIFFSTADGNDQYKDEIGKYYEYLKSEEDDSNENAFDRQNGKACIIRYSPSKADGKNEKNVMLELLNEYLPVEINSGLIPFDMAERKRLYVKAFEELEEFMNE